METGFLLIHKERDWTSHDVVGYLRKITRIKKIGHAGTLDPFATGLLIVGVGREATRRLDEFKGMPKTYIATLHLGATSDTFDETGTLTPSTIVTPLPQESLDTVLASFVGEQEQIPPMYSAKKINGQRLYELARQGIEVERKANKITIFNIKLLHAAFPLVTIEVNCSTGTYIRTLVHDIGQKLGCGAYCKSLERTQIGPYALSNALSVKELNKENWKNALIESSANSFET